MSKQHIFPDRLRRVLPRTDTAHQLGGWSRYTKRGKLVRSEERRKNNQGSFANSRIRRVCKTCNNGWLKEMEEDCFPLVERLITGELEVLQRPEQRKIARVTTSIAMVGEWLHADFVYTTQAERENFKRTLEPPPHWYFFIGKNGTGEDNARFGSDGLTEVGEAPHFVSFTIIMGPVLLHVFVSGRGITFFDPILYARHLGLYPIYPPTDWINFRYAPAHSNTDVERVRAFAGWDHKRRFGA